MQLQISNLSKSYFGQNVLQNVTFSIENSERTSIVGKNGSGKSTLLKIIIGEEQVDSGVVSISKNITIGYIPQAPEYDPEMVVIDFLQFTGKDTIETHTVLSALSTFGMESLSTFKMHALSSGQRTKVYLVRLLLIQPDLLLLDEPTNHLDIESLTWLEDYLIYYLGSVLFVSHDRMFLDSVATKVLELEDGKVTVYGGNYTFYKNEKEIRRQAYEQQYITQQSHIKRLTQELIEKRTLSKTKNVIRKKSSTSRAEAGFFANRQSQIFGSVAKNMQKRLETMEKLQRPESIPELKALFCPKTQSGESVVLLKDITKFYNDISILKDITLHIARKDRVAFLGANGSGKSTLVKIITGEILPDKGAVHVGTNVTVGYLSQEHAELTGDHSVLSELEDKTKLSQTDAYKLLVRFLLPKEKIHQSVNTLSSGEKSKLLLAEIMAFGSNFLILDEPTNHLDIPSREALEEAISNYDGTLLVISHDRYFLERIGITKKVMIENGTLSLC